MRLLLSIQLLCLSLCNHLIRVRALRSNVSRRTRAASATAGSAEDVAEHLIAAASGGSGSRDRMLRGVFRKAVEHQYNATQAVARIHAVFGHQYRFEVSNASSQRLGDGNEPPALMRKLKVTYKRGMGLRGEYMDEVDLIPAEILKTILRLPLLEQANDPADATDSGLNREVLKPINLAKASPRIYWSIVFHHGNDVAGSIAAMIADIDNGEWLFDRKRELSEKAKENKRQQDEKELLRHAKKRKVGGEIAVNLESTGGVASSSIPSDLMEKVTNLQLDEEVLDAEIVGSLCGHLGGDRVIMLAEADGPTLCGKSGLSLDQIEFFIRSAQTRIHEVVYCHLLHGSQALKVVLNRLRIRCMKELLIWKSAGSGLFDGLIAVGPQITQLNLRWPDHEGLTCEDVEALLRLADACSNRWRFLCDIEASQSIIEDCEQWEEADRDQSVDEDIWADSWSIDAESNEFIGKRTRIFDCADASACSWWEDGIVVGFLPSSIEEPMALWRVRFDSFTAKSDSRAGRFEDLEQHEVDLAVKRLAL